MLCLATGGPWIELNDVAADELMCVESGDDADETDGRLCGDGVRLLARGVDGSSTWIRSVDIGRGGGRSAVMPSCSVTSRGRSGTSGASGGMTNGTPPKSNDAVETIRCAAPASND